MSPAGKNYPVYSCSEAFLIPSHLPPVTAQDGAVPCHRDKPGSYSGLRAAQRSKPSSAWKWNFPAPNAFSVKNKTHFSSLHEAQTPQSSIQMSIQEAEDFTELFGSEFVI